MNTKKTKSKPRTREHTSETCPHKRTLDCIVGVLWPGTGGKRWTIDTLDDIAFILQNFDLAPTPDQEEWP